VFAVVEPKVRPTLSYGSAGDVTPVAVSAGSTLLIEADNAVKTVTGWGAPYGGVYQWDDLSGNGWNFTQSTDANRPLWIPDGWKPGYGAVRFNGVSGFLQNLLTGPNSDSWTLYLLAKGAKILSALRFQGTGAIYTVLAWGAGNVVINSADGGGGGGLSTGFVAGAKNLITVVYERNTANGFRTYRNGTLVAQRTTSNNAQPNQQLFMGRYNPTPGEYLDADVALGAFYQAGHNTATREANEAAVLAKWGVS
jgi:hypothetical protein